MRFIRQVDGKKKTEPSASLTGNDHQLEPVRRQYSLMPALTTTTTTTKSEGARTFGGRPAQDPDGDEDAFDWPARARGSVSVLARGRAGPHRPRTKMTLLLPRHALKRERNAPVDVAEIERAGVVLLPGRGEEGQAGDDDAEERERRPAEAECRNLDEGAQRSCG